MVVEGGTNLLLLSAILDYEAVLEKRMVVLCGVEVP